METGTAFWHMVDLVWVLLFPVIYLPGDRPAHRAWALPIALGLATTALAARGTVAGTPWLGALILAIAFLKMRLILTRYLGLADAPFWRRGFDADLGLFVLLLLGLYLIPMV